MTGSVKSPIRVLIADDSVFFQQRIRNMIDSHPAMSVVAVASNGQEAVNLARTTQPDVITMDYEMPVMDGVSAVKAIMAQKPVPILMFSTLTYDGARITLDALAAGAVDFLPKNFTEVSREASSLANLLHEKIQLLSAHPAPHGHSHRNASRREAHTGASGALPMRGLGGSESRSVNSSGAVAATSSPSQVEKRLINPRTPASGSLREVSFGHINAVKGGKLPPKVVLLGASTGGPVALASVLKAIPSDFPVPIVIIQHMPAQFTKAFAERLNRQCQIDIKEAEDGDELQAGHAFLAPGGQQLVFDTRQPRKIRIIDGDSSMSYRPALDITFASAAKHFAKQALAVVMTGMGSDGSRGGQLIHQAGGRIWAQDEASSVIYGMPRAVAEAQCAEQILPLTAIAETLISQCVLQATA